MTTTAFTPLVSDPLPAPVSAFDRVVNDFLVDFFPAYPISAGFAGWHLVDQSWPDLSETSRVGRLAMLQRHRAAAESLAETDLSPGQRVDDLVSAELNFAANTLDVEPDGAYRLTVVRRARREDEGPDDVSPSGYHAELVTVRFRASPDAATGRLTAAVDLTGFSSWARKTRPARVAFGPDRHLESVTSSLILGTTFALHLTSAS